MDDDNTASRCGCHRGVPRAGSLELGWLAAAHAMKVIGTILLFAWLVSTSGCITYSTVKRAKGEENSVVGRPAGEPQPGCYALLPLTVPADVATSPFQLILFLLAHASVASGGAPL